MALLRGSHELTEVFEPNTWLVERKKSFSAVNPSDPIMSVAISGKQNHAVIPTSARYISPLG